MTELTVVEWLLHMPLMLLASSLLLGIALVPAQSALMTTMQLAVPDQKRGRVGSALNARTAAAGLVGLAMLQEPEAELQVDRKSPEETIQAAKVPAD